MPKPAIPAEAYRATLTRAIRQLWVTFATTHDAGVEELTDEDATLWQAVTEHSAVQGPLSVPVAPRGAFQN